MNEKDVQRALGLLRKYRVAFTSENSQCFDYVVVVEELNVEDALMKAKIMLRAEGHSQKYLDMAEYDIELSTDEDDG
jgi:hypothetical protein